MDFYYYILVNIMHNTNRSYVVSLAKINLSSKTYVVGPSILDVVAEIQ